MTSEREWKSFNNHGISEPLPQKLSADSVVYDKRAKTLTIDGRVFPYWLLDFKVLTGRPNLEDAVVITLATKSFTLD